MNRYVVIASICAPLVATPASSRTWHIQPDGFGDAPTIQAGVDSAAAGDTVEVACGTYYDCLHWDPDGYFNCVIMKSGVILRSSTGNPTCVTIDAQEHGRVIYCSGTDASTRIEGLTLRGGSLPSGPRPVGAGIALVDASLVLADCRIEDNAASMGGGIYCSGGALQAIACRVGNNTGIDGGGLYAQTLVSLSLDAVVFSENSAVRGGGISLWGSDPSIVRCSFYRNTAEYGGAILASYSSPTITHCTLAANHASLRGSGIEIHEGADPLTIENTIIAFGSGTVAVGCQLANQTTIRCSDVFGNAGDWNICIASQQGVWGNFSEDPLFCDLENGSLVLSPGSPCLDAWGCGLVGAWGEGCGPVGVRGYSWGRVKGLYRDAGGR